LLPHYWNSPSGIFR